MSLEPVVADLDRDGEEVRALNNAAVPAVNALSRDEFTEICGMGRLTVVRDESADTVLGALLTLPSGQPYGSLNYQWFGARYGTFLYVDRIVVRPTAHGLGIGRALYDEAIAQGAARGVPVLCAEVNVDPPNPGSQAFHERLGFVGLEDRFNEEAGKTVRMLARQLTPG